jgi:hypothetical protein
MIGGMWTWIAALFLVAQGSPALPLAETSLYHLTGHWAISGTTQGEPTTGGAFGTWAFHGKFLELLVDGPPGPDGSVARIFFARDGQGNLSVHWLDAAGGERARTLGRGRIDGNEVIFVFDYPDAQFRNRLTYDSEKDSWRFRIETGPADAPRLFADWTFRRDPR